MSFTAPVLHGISRDLQKGYNGHVQMRFLQKRTGLTDEQYKRFLNIVTIKKTDSGLSARLGHKGGLSLNYTNICKVLNLYIEVDNYYQRGGWYYANEETFGNGSSNKKIHVKERYKIPSDLLWCMAEDYVLNKGVNNDDIFNVYQDQVDENRIAELMDHYKYENKDKFLSDVSEGKVHWQTNKVYNVREGFRKTSSTNWMAVEGTWWTINGKDYFTREPLNSFRVDYLGSNDGMHDIEWAFKLLLKQHCNWSDKDIRDKFHPEPLPTPQHIIDYQIAKQKRDIEREIRDEEYHREFGTAVGSNPRWR